MAGRQRADGLLRCQGHCGRTAIKQIGIAAKFEKSADENLHPANQAAIIADGKQIGVVGELHPSVKEHFELTQTVYLFEINIPLLLPLIKDKVYRPIPKFPATVRDIALVVDIGVTHQQILDTMKGFSLVTDVALFDVYSGEQVPAGKKSMAYRLTFQSPDKTLTDQQINGVQQAILKKLTTGLGATLERVEAPTPKSGNLLSGKHPDVCQTIVCRHYPCLYIIKKLKLIRKL